MKLNVTRSGDAQVLLKMILSEGKGVRAFGAELSYPSDMLSFVSVHPSDLAASWEFIDGMEIQPGLLIVGGFDGEGVRTKSPGGLMEALFRVNDGAEGGAEFTVRNFVDDLEGANVNPVSVTILPTRVEKLSGTQTPASFALEQNYPNPFNRGTDIRYQLADVTEVNLSIYNAAGQRITTLISGVQEAGRYIAHWEGQDARGAAVSSGIYLYRLTTAGFSDVKKMVVIQ